MKKFTILEEESGMHSPPAIFIRAGLEHEKLIGYSVKNVLWYGQDGHFKWAYVLGEIRKAGNIILKKILNDKKFSKTISLKIRNLSSQLHNFSKEIRRINISKKDNKFLGRIYKRYCQILKELYFWGMLIELMDVHYNLFSNFLKKELKKAIRQRDLKKNLTECFVILTTPTEESFTKKQEKDFLKLASKINKSKKLKETIELDKKINQHLNKYCWVNYNYEGPAMDKESLIDLLGRAAKISPDKELKQIKERAEADKQSQKKLIRDLNPDKQLGYLIKLAKEFPTLKMIRKESIFHSCYAVDRVRIEISKRLGISLNQCRTIAMFPEEVIRALELNKINKAELRAREKEMTYFLNNGKEEIYTGQRARKLAQENIIEEELEKVGEIEGSPACLGRASGAVKIIKSTKDISKMKQGNILVAMATNPTFVPAMKKAGAIITDMGGITCHAAIVSRELNIPCIIGTKIATKVLKDGDLVEVDANKGVVRIIKKAK